VVFTYTGTGIPKNDPRYEAEYKYVLTAAICLSAFPSLALEAVVTRLKRLALPALALASLVLAGPFVHKVYRDWPWTKAWTADGTFVSEGGPRLDLRGFDSRLDPGEQLAACVTALREGTPKDTIVVVAKTALHLPTLTRRKLYVPPLQKEGLPGMAMDTDYLLIAIKGYDKREIGTRRSTVAATF
jgi:hypothetical protein